MVLGNRFADNRLLAGGGVDGGILPDSFPLQLVCRMGCNRIFGHPGQLFYQPAGGCL